MSTMTTHVLCVDDQRDSSSLLERHLSSHFDCTIAASPEECLEQLERNAGYAVVVADYMMPHINGVELLKVIKQRWPDIVGVMVTAMDAIDVAISALNEGNVYRFVRKPWREDEIVNAVREAAAYHALVLSERTLREELARMNAELDEKVQDLDEANELLEYWVEFSPAVLYSFACERGVLHPSYIGKNFHRLTGFERTAAVVDPAFWSTLIEVQDRPRYQEALARLVSGVESHTVLEYHIRHRGGGGLEVLDSMRAVHDGEGSTIELIGAWVDVSARR